VPDSATGSVCLNVNGGGGGSRTRVRKYSPAGVYMFSPVKMFIVPWASPGLEAFNTIRCMVSRSEPPENPGRYPASRCPTPIRRSNRGDSSNLCCYSIFI